MRGIIGFLSLVLCFASTTLHAQQTLYAHKVASLPQIDGLADDHQWQDIQPLLTYDAIADLDITLKMVYTDEHVALLVTFPDSTENRDHRRLYWDSEKQIYQQGKEREDTFVVKWNMEFYPVDLTISADEPYNADIWYWKSFRTDHAGYADDKHQIYSDVEMRGSHRVISKGGNTYYLLRKGDEGKGAYKGLLPIDNSGDGIPGFELRTPQGSRADVRAKGVWRDGVWSVEFARKLNTTHQDDIQLEPGMSFQFGVSRYEIAGRQPDPNIEIPYFGSGEITEPLILKFE